MNYYKEELKEVLDVLIQLEEEEEISYEWEIYNATKVIRVRNLSEFSYDEHKFEIPIEEITSKENLKKILANKSSEYIIG